MTDSSIRLAVDIGGTFTDVVVETARGARPTHEEGADHAQGAGRRRDGRRARPPRGGRPVHRREDYRPHASRIVAVDGGAIRFDAENITHLPPQRRRTAMALRNYALSPRMTVFDNVAYSLRLKRVPAAEIRTRVRSALASLAETLIVPGTAQAADHCAVSAPSLAPPT